MITQITDSDLRTMADDVYEDLIDAASLCPNTEWHESIFFALHVICAEMVSRNMPPPVAKGITQRRKA